MKKNVGMLDKVIRLLVALAFIVLYFAGIVTGVVGIVLLVLAAVFVLTALIGFCPLYLPVHINTSKKK